MQEIVSNVLKHADATKISINLLENDHSIDLIVKDNGVGFNVNKFQKKISGYGLVNIKSRVKGFNGKMTIENNDPQGTVIEITLNLTPEDLA
jgi:signal transduction histidine kinase